MLFNSAYDLKNVNWEYGELQPYAVTWIDSGKKRSTKIDATNGVNPVWNELITIPLPPTSHVESAILFTDIVHAKSAAGMKPLIGSVKLPVKAILDKAARSNGKASFSLILKRPSGRPQGELEIQIEIIDANIIQREPYGQQPRYIPAQPQLQPQPRPQPRPQLQPQYQPRPMNQNPNVQGFVAPGYRVNSNPRPNLIQQPGNGMLMPRPQYRPVVNQQPSVASALCALTLGVTPNQIGRMVRSVERMSIRAFNVPQPVNMGMANNTGMLGNSGTDATYANDPAAAQGYVDATGYDEGSYTMGTTDGVGYDGGAFDGSQFGTDGGLDLGGFDASGLDFGGEA